MKRYKRDWEDGITLSFRMSWLLALVCASPDRSRVALAQDIRRAMFKVFHFDLVYREVDGLVQVLTIAHHRRELRLRAYCPAQQLRPAPLTGRSTCTISLSVCHNSLQNSK